jgi:hypothetical protein
MFMKSETKTLDQVICDAEANRKTVFEVVENLEKGGKRLEVSFIDQKPVPVEPVPSPAKKRAHEFNDIEGLGAYLQKYGTDATVVLGDVNALEARVSLSEWEGDGGHEVLTYKPVFHPAFATWMQIVGRTIPVLDFASFVMANRRFVEGGRSLALLFSQMRASKQIEIAQGKGKKAINGVMVTIEISGTRTEEFQELPETLAINVPVFLQSETSRVELDLLVSEKNNEIYVSVSASDVDVVKANQFIADIKSLAAMLPKVNCTFGKIGFKEGEFLRG